MAQITTVRLVCDGEHDSEVEASESINFGVGRRAFTIDLCDAHAADFRDAMTPWQRAARRANGQQDRGTTATASRNDSKAVRAFGRSRGIDVKDRGRIHPDVLLAWGQLSEAQRQTWRNKVT